MLTFATGIFDPDNRLDSLLAAAEATGSDLDETILGPIADGIGDVLGNPPAPTEWADYAARLSEYLSVLVVTNVGLTIDRVTGGQAAIADVDTANATDLASAQALANALKTKVNTLLAELRTAGILDT